MSRLSILVRNLLRRKKVERDLDDEVRGYATMLEDENRVSGLNASAARRQANLQLGGIEAVKEEVRTARPGFRLESVLQDLRFAFRMLRKNPGFTAVAVLTLALGIGANTAVFSVIRGVLLQTLPFSNPSQIVMVRGTVGGQPTGSISYPDYLDYRARNASLQEVGAYTALDLVLGEADHSERIPSEMATGSYFAALGISPFMGRALLSDDNKSLGASAVAVIGYGLWQRAFAADPAIVGKTIRLSDSTYTIVGVMPRGFTGFSDKADLWIPIMMHDAVWPQTAKFNIVFGRGNRWLRMVARLRDGVSLAQVQSESDSIAAALREEHPDENKDRGFLVRRAQDVFVGAARKPLLMLLGAVGFVLLIACANVMNLVLAKMVSRDAEFALRVALGAPRSRLVRQLLTECFALASAGAIAAVCIVMASVRVLVSLFPLTFPSYAVVHVDREVLAFTALVTIITAGLLASLPALSLGRRELHETLKEAGRSGGARNRSTHSALIVAEVALAAVLLVGAGLLLKSFAQLIGGDTGFRPDHLVTLRFEVPTQITGEARNRFGPNLAGRIAQMPEVESAAVTFVDPFVWGGFGRGFTVEDHERLSTSEQDSITYQEAGPGYFGTMGIQVLQGREFTQQDSLSAPRVVVVNRAFARKFWPGLNPIGKRVKYGATDSKYPWMEVVGVVADTKFDSLRQDPADSPVICAAVLQSEVVDDLSVVIRTKVDPASMVPALRQQISAYDPEIALFSVATLRERMLDSSADARAYAALLGIFAGIAAVLCAIGIYGVISFWVAQRTREIGIRLALGAGRPEILRLAAIHGLRLTFIGLSAGLAASLALTRALAGMLYEVKPFDPGVFAAMIALMAAVALLACWIPARRAMNVDPIIALRNE
jgi:predicted permease